MSSAANVVVVALASLVVIIAAQAYMATRPHAACGLLIPAGFLSLVGHNLYKSLFVSNPYPNMAEGMFMAFGLAGFAASAVVLIVCRRGRSSRAQ